MENDLLGLLRIHVRRGCNLAIRDARSSDPYVIVRMGKQKLKTRVIKKSLNPEWNENLTLCITDPTLPIKIVVYDHDTFTFDDKMGDAEFEIGTFLESVVSKAEGVPDGTILRKVIPDRHNCLAEESCIAWKNGRVVQDIVLRLRNVECGEVEMQLQWINSPNVRKSE